MAKKKSAGLLAGIRILDLTRVLAGPHCTMVLGDLGADVIKVEEPGRGDDTRHWGPPFTKSGMSAYFISANRNKRSMTLNLKSKAGISVLKDLVKKADVLVENFKPGTLERLGVSEKALKKLNPDLVYCTITGYGYSGPESENPGYDFIAQARGGLMSITGAADGEPIRVGVAIVDLLSGIYACNAIVAALFARERQKKWQRIDISLLDSMVGSMSYVASNYLVSGNLPKRFGNAHPNIVPYQGFAASDGYFAFAAGNDLQWARFCKAIGREDWARDERFALNPSRVKNRQELIGMLDELFAAKSTEEWLKICEEAGVPAAAVKSMDQVLADPQVQAREMVQTIKIAEEEIRILASPIKIPTAPAKLRFPPPSLGEHTDEILSSLLKYKKAQISKLRNAKVI
jgi:crotonobetainyl-CoA:carnitine CoA-transferase CaiB-like acyl-CoA transferase